MCDYDRGWAPTNGDKPAQRGYKYEQPPDDDDDDDCYTVDDLEEIHNSIVNNDIEQLREACEADADVNEKFTDDIDPQHTGMTPLALASALNRVQHVKMLLDFRANVNDTFASLETTALMTSSFHGHEKVVRLLLSRGANSRAVDKQGSTALGYAFGGSRSIEVVKMLLKAGVDVNQKNMLGMNALLLVAGYGNDMLVKLVLQNGAEPNAVNDFGHSALHLAVVGKRSQVAALCANRGATSLYGLNRRDIDQLLKDWCSSHRDLLGIRQPDSKQLEDIGTFMMAIGQKLDEPEGAINQDDQEAMRRRIEAVLRYREERLQTAKDAKKPGAFDTFLSCGGKRSKQAKGKTAGSAASAPLSIRPATFDNKPTSADVDRDVLGLSDRCALIMRDVLDAGCAVDKTENTFGMTALDMAILMGDVESTAQLLAAGADPDHLLKLFALSELYEATVLHPDKKKTKDLLAEDDKIDVNQPYANFNITKNPEPTTTGQAIEPVGDEGLVPVAAVVKGNSGESAEIIKILIKKGAQINKIGPAGRSALAEACRSDNVKMVQSLISQGADIELVNPYYKDATPVVVGVICKNPKVVQLLIDKGAKIDKPMTDGRTSVVKAMENADMPMIDVLLAADKEVNYANKGSFVYEMADLYQRDDRDIEKILRRIAEKVQEHKQHEEQQRASKLDPTPEPAPKPVQQQIQQQQQPAPWSQPAYTSSVRAPQPPQFDSEEEEATSEDEEPSPPPPVAKGRSKQQQPPQPQPKPKQQQQQQPERTKSQQQKPNYRPPPPPQEPSDEEESEEESEEEEEPPRPPQAQARQSQVSRQQQPQQAPRPQQSVRQQQQPQPPRTAQQQLKPQSRQNRPPPPPQEPSSEEEEEESEEEEEEEEEVIPPPKQMKPVQQPRPAQQPQPRVQQQPKPQQPPSKPQQQPPKPQPKPQQPKPQSRPPPPPQEPSDEEESEEEEEEEEQVMPPPPPVAKKPVAPPVLVSQNRRNEPPPRQAAVPAKPSPPQKVTKQPSLPSSPPPPLPATGPPDESSEEETSEEDESFEEPPPPPPPAVKQQPRGAVNHNNVSTTTTTRVVKSGGGTNSASTTVTKTMVTKIIKSSQGTARTAVAPPPARAQVEEFDSDEDEESEEEEEEDVNRNAYAKRPVAVQRPSASRRHVMSAETDI